MDMEQRYTRLSRGGGADDVLATVWLAAHLPSPLGTRVPKPLEITMHVMLLAAGLAAGTVQADTTYLYRTLLIRAAPDRLLEVIDLYKARNAVYRAAGEHPPFMLRHSQGDQWDLMLLFPMRSFQAYWSDGSVTQRREAAVRSGMTDDAFQERVGGLVSWREEVYVVGPAWEVVAAAVNGGSFYHVEMFVALPDKRAELFTQREMENDYLARLDRPQNLIFSRRAGAAWDAFTLGVYRDLKHYAESADIPEDAEQRAAVAAGFEGADRIGTYLRTLILYHHDTLATAVP
jgi:hypothetical protein